MQTVLDSYMESYNQRRPHQGRDMPPNPRQPKEEMRAEKRTTKQAA